MTANTHCLPQLPAPSTILPPPSPKEASRRNDHNDLLYFVTIPEAICLLMVTKRPGPGHQWFSCCHIQGACSFLPFLVPLAVFYTAHHWLNPAWNILSFFCFPNSTCSQFSPNFVAISRYNQSVIHPPPPSLCKIYSSSVNTLLLLSQSLTVVLTLLLIPDPFANLRKSMDPAHRKYLYTGFCKQFQGVNPNTSWRKKPALHMFSGNLIYCHDFNPLMTALAL